MEYLQTQPVRKTGRPLSFDRDAALHQAMLTFWRHGYEATSLTALTSSMGITPPSLYAAFGDKKRLFLEAIQLYLTGNSSQHITERLIDEAPSARAAAEAMLQSSAIAFTGTDTPAGCLLASSAISCSAAAADVKQELAAVRLATEAHLAAKFQHDPYFTSGNPPADATTMASYVMTIIQGMSTLARDGAPRDKLLAIVKVSMAIWPG